MAVNGVNMSGYFNYYSAVSQVRLQQALARNPKIQQAVAPVDRVNGVSDSLKNSSADFLRLYNSNMSDVMKSANNLRGMNSGSAVNDLEAVSSDLSVADVSARYRLRDEKSMELNVSQLAGAQQNVSSAVSGSAAAAGDMSFTISSRSGSFSDIQVAVSSANENGGVKTNRQMLKEAALQINQAQSGVRASVVEKDGELSLQLDGARTGTAAAFTVSGQLGAAAGLERTAAEAQNAVYTVKEGNSEQTRTSQTNNITLDLGRMDVQLKGTGTTTLSAQVNDDKIISAVSDLADNYNKTLKFMDENAGHGQGVVKQIGSFVRDLAPGKTMEMLGLTTEKDGTLTLDKSKLAASLKKDPALVRDLISGQNGIAQKAFDRAMNGMRENSGSLLSNDFQKAEELMNNPINFMNMYAKNGRSNLNNYCALGLMINYLV